MKAVTYTEYGSAEVLRLEEIAKPTPKDDEVLIRIRAASVNALDCHFMHGRPGLMRLVTGARKPKVTRLGVDVAGTIEAVGPNVTELHPGDEVYGVCRGAFAEYACAPMSKVVIKSANVSFEQAAALPVACVTALQGLRDKAKVQAGQKVLINGAGGGVGSFAVQIAKMFGAEVTAVTTTKKIGMVRAAGADYVIDYTREDFTASGKKYDMIFDLGVTHSWSDVKRVMSRDGAWLFVGGVVENGLMRPFIELFKGFMQSTFATQKVQLVSGRVTRDDLILMDKLVSEGKVAPVIDSTYPLTDVAKAVTRVERGLAAGKVVITVP
jgi:NADPH:quinone reductase-like Zn-dependent oxidoreductase